MSSTPAFPSQQSETSAHRAAVALHGMALNSLFPPPPRLPGDMMQALAKLDNVRR